MRFILFIPVLLLFLSDSFNWSDKKQADLLVYNATIYTVDSSFSTAEAMVISKGRIVAVGKSGYLQAQFAAREKLNAKGRFIYPGFIDAHAHFMGYGSSL